MADMIEAKDAKKLLGCDDAALTNLVNSGQIKAQRVGGKLMLLKSDVEKVAASGDGDDGTIVLTGDSDDLSIDLGKVVDDSAETIVTNKKATDTAAGTESITFGEDLEVVSFDDNSNTGEIAFDQNKKGQNLSFTDSNTAVMTAVDETAVGATTQPVEFQTEANEPAQSSNRSPSQRLGSARSQRASVEVQKVHWFWTTCLVLTMLITVFLVVPYYVISMFPYGNGSEKLSNKDRRLGVDDSAWTSMASGLAGFTVEPNRDRYVNVYKGTEWMGLKESGRDNQAIWRRDSYRGGGEKFKGKPESELVGMRVNDFTFEIVPGQPSPLSEDGKTIKSKSDLMIPIRERPVGDAQRQITESYPDVSSAK